MINDISVHIIIIIIIIIIILLLLLLLFIKNTGTLLNVQTYAKITSKSLTQHVVWQLLRK